MIKAYAAPIRPKYLIEKIDPGIKIIVRIELYWTYRVKIVFFEIPPTMLKGILSIILTCPIKHINGIRLRYASYFFRYNFETM